MIKRLSTACFFALLFGVSANTVVLKNNAAPYETTAKKELSAALGKVKNGVYLNGKKAVFHIGTKPKSFKGALEDESWNIISEGNHVYIFGGGMRGTLYATAIFLEKYLGVRYWSPVETLVPEHDRIELKKLNLSGKPCFFQRHHGTHWRVKLDHGRYHVMNRMNLGARDWKPEFGSEVGWGSPSHVHTFPMYISEKEFSKTHPEYFALKGNGVREPNMYRGQLCLSNPDLPAVFIEKMKKYILEDEKKAKKNGTAAPRMYELSQFDNNTVCGCEKCKKMREELGGESGLQLNLISKVAEEIGKFRPNIKITTLAYHQTTKPPTKALKLPYNVVVRLCNTDPNFAAGILSPDEKNFRDLIRKWKEISTGGLMTWEYGVSFNRMASCLPYPSEFFMQERARYYRDHGIMGIVTQRDSTYCSDVWILKAYLQAKIMENPDLDFEAALRDFTDKYYGAAGKYIAQYRKLIYDSVQKHKPFILGFGPQPYVFKHLDADTVLKSAELFDKAEKAVKNDAEMLRRVREARMGIDQAVIILQRKLEWERPGISKKLDVKSCRERWKNTVKKASIFYLREDRSSMVVDRFSANYDILPESIPPQKKVPGGLEIPVETIAWHANHKDSKLVLDKGSETGYAAMIPATVKDFPLKWGTYDQKSRTGKNYSSIKPDEVKNAGFNWYKLKPIELTVSGYMYMMNGWKLHCPVPDLAMTRPGKSWIPWVCLKFKGPAFPHGKKEDKNAILISRIVFEPAE